MGLKFNFERIAGSERNGALVTCVDVREDSDENKVYSFALELKYGKNRNKPEDWKLTDAMIFKDVSYDEDPKEIKSESGVRRLLKRLGLEKKLLVEKLIEQKPEVEMPESESIRYNDVCSGEVISHRYERNLNFYAIVEKEKNKNIYWLVGFENEDFKGFKLMPNSEEYDKIASLDHSKEVTAFEARDTLSKRMINRPLGADAWIDN